VKFPKQAIDNIIALRQARCKAGQIPEIKKVKRRKRKWLD